MLEYSLVPFHQIGEYVAKSVNAHYEEASEIDFYEPLNMDWDYYLQASHLGKCVAVVPTYNLIPVGYSVFFIDSNVSHKDVLEAENAGIYLEPDYRAKYTEELFEKTKDFLKALGVDKINFQIKREAFGRLLKKYNYQNEYAVWSIRT